MLRILSDQMEAPVFGMHLQQDDETLEYELPDGVRIVPIPLVLGKKKGLNTALRRALSPEIKETIDRCSAVYLRQPLWECWDVFRYARSRGKRILVSYHGDWPDALRRSDATGLKRLFNLALALYVDHVFKVMARHCELAFCVGQDLQDKYGRLAKRSVVFANFLHSKDDIASPHALNESPPYRILFVGGFEEYKGVKYLIRAAGILEQKNLDFKLTLVGAGSLEQDLRAQVRSEGIDQHVEWPGYIQHGKELMEFYRQADLFVLPSIASEGTAKVLMEAMSQGVPVIATDAGGNSHFLEDGEYGVLTPSKDAIKMASAIQNLLGDTELRTAFIQKGSDLARSSTREKQKEIVKTALESAMPEIIGAPKYLDSSHIHHIGH